MPDTNIETRDTGEELAVIGAEEQALIDAAKSNIDSSKLVLPALKVTNALTAEVQNGNAEAGHLINSLTGEDYGDTVEIVVSALFDGRFYSDDDGSYAAQGAIAPDSWPEEYRGKAFTDIDDAEERWKVDSNEGLHEWGKGPPISTTHNFVGYVIGDEAKLPVRLSLMRTGNKAAAKLNTLIFAARAPWDRTFVLKTKRDTNAKQQAYYTLEVSQGGVTDPELRQAAVRLAQDFASYNERGDVELEGDAPDDKPKRAKPGKRAGLDVS